MFSSASQIAFYLETGAELNWSSSRKFANDPSGWKLLASGSVGIALCTAALTFTATLLNPWLYNTTGDILRWIHRIFRSEQQGALLTRYRDEPGTEVETVEKPPSAPRRLWLWRILLCGSVATVLLLRLVRPRRSPFGHLSGTLPFDLYQAFVPSVLAACAPVDFQNPLGYGTARKVNNISDMTLPSWLPQTPVPGFDRFYWHVDANDTDWWRPYDAHTDVARISNLGSEVLQPLSQAFKDKDLSIKHVVLFHLESTRQDAFPIRNDSHLHELLVQEMGSFADVQALNAELGTISKNAEVLTGQAGGLGRRSIIDTGWRSRLEEGKGGINLIDSITVGTSTLKSLIGSICGASPLPVDFDEEANLPFYQACLPHIFSLLSQNKTADPNAPVQDRPWKSVHAQAITDQFDHQNDLMEKMGFDQSIAKSFLIDPFSKHYPPKEPEANYFGFPEPELKPYLHDLFATAERQGHRLFLSHLTSTTHHPWSVPETFGIDEEYLSRWHWKEERPLNRYLNTLRYQDRWIGDFMDMLESLGVLDDTLVVFAGDQ